MTASETPVGVSEQVRPTVYDVFVRFMSARPPRRRGVDADDLYILPPQSRTATENERRRRRRRDELTRLKPVRMYGKCGARRLPVIVTQDMLRPSGKAPRHAAGPPSPAAPAPPPRRPRCRPAMTYLVDMGRESPPPPPWFEIFDPLFTTLDMPDPVPPLCVS